VARTGGTSVPLLVIGIVAGVVGGVLAALWLAAHEGRVSEKRQL